MLNRFLQELQALAGENALHKRYLLAVSGGADSTVMATLFHEAGLSFAIAHCNFHLRGADSDRDMRFVQQLAAQWQVPLYLQEFDTLTLQKNSGKSVEMVARELRYTWFSEIAGDYDFIVTAHQSTDAAETMLLNLCRGTGLKGLCGIPSKNGKIIRPMLVFTAEEIRQYAEDHHIAYVEDITNRDEEISRNRIRHSVIPQMETLNPQFVSTTATSRQILQRQYAYYQKHIAADIQKVVSEQNGQCRINRSKLAECDDLELVLYEILNEYGFPAIVSEKLSVNSFFQPGKQFFSDTHILLIDRDFLLIQPKANSEEACVNIVSQEELSQYFDIEEFEYQKDMVFEKNPDILYLPKDKLTFPLQIRSWRSGDYFYPLGTKGRQKLSDFFTDHKIDRFTKSKIRLLCSEDQIIWIIGWRSDERFKIQEKNTICYKICNRKL
ncbi:MAG: tRNA lysidine(34) synthetase TilS [Bacteroidales bacterium]|nr:tRNA lysidine(34) synthetase TilS [Bacteroidales bacterium]